MTPEEIRATIDAQMQGPPLVVTALVVHSPTHVPMNDEDGRVSWVPVVTGGPLTLQFVGARLVGWECADVRLPIAAEFLALKVTL